MVATHSRRELSEVDEMHPIAIVDNGERPGRADLSIVQGSLQSWGMLSAHCVTNLPIAKKRRAIRHNSSFLIG